MWHSNLNRVCLLLIALFILTLTVKTHAQPEGWSIIQLTDNDYDDSQPQIYGSNVVWYGFDGNNEIFFYDGNTTTQLTTNNNYSDDYDWFQIYGSNVVWIGSDGNDTEIFFYDGNTTTQLTNNLCSDLSPQIHGSNIVWRSWDGNDYEIFFYDGNTTTQLTNNIYRDCSPRIHGSNVAWLGEPDGNDYEIFFYDGNTTTQLTNNIYDDYSPQIHGSNVVWQGRGGLGWDRSDYEIFCNTTGQLTNNSYDDRSPQIHGSNVVWEGGGEIFFYEGNTTTQLTNNSYTDHSPHIYGSNVVWEGWGEIFFYDGSTTTQLTDNNYYGGMSQVYGSNVVWCAFDGNDWEIFLAKPILPPVQAQIKLTPHMLNCESNGKWVKAHVIMPEEIYPEDIDVNTPAIAEPVEVESEFIEVNEYSDGCFDVQIYFDREIFCQALSESEDGLLEVTVTGSLLDGRKFEGSDTIRLKSELWQHRIRKDINREKTLELRKTKQ